MKRKLLLFGAVALLFGTFVIQGCNDTNDDMPAPELTKADLVVASPEYQNYSKAFAANSRKIVAAIKKLTPEERLKLAEVLNLNSSNTDVDILVEAGKILKYDLKAGFAKVKEQKSKLDLSGIELRDLIRAKVIYRKNERLSRTSNSGEGESNKSKYESCANDCNDIHEAEYADCNGDWDCEEHVGASATGCINQCDYLYPQG